LTDRADETSGRLRKLLLNQAREAAKVQPTRRLVHTLNNVVQHIMTGLECLETADDDVGESQRWMSSLKRASRRASSTLADLRPILTSGRTRIGLGEAIEMALAHVREAHTDLDIALDVDNVHHQVELDVSVWLGLIEHCAAFVCRADTPPTRLHIVVRVVDDDIPSDRTASADTGAGSLADSDEIAPSRGSRGVSFGKETGSMAAESMLASSSTPSVLSTQSDEDASRTAAEGFRRSLLGLTRELLALDGTHVETDIDGEFRLQVTCAPRGTPTLDALAMVIATTRERARGLVDDLEALEIFALGGDLHGARELFATYHDEVDAVILYLEQALESERRKEIAHVLECRPLVAIGAADALQGLDIDQPDVITLAPGLDPRRYAAAIAGLYWERRFRDTLEAQRHATTTND